MADIIDITISSSKKIDLKISNEGDLVFEDSVVAKKVYDENGEPTYTEVTEKDFQLIGDSEEVKQNLFIRLKTNFGEFLMHPEIGSKLKKIIGKKNTKDTALLAKQYLYEALTDKNWINMKNVNIDVIPSSSTVLMFVIRVDLGYSNFVSFVMEFDVLEGVRRLL